MLENKQYLTLVLHGEEGEEDLSVEYGEESSPDTNKATKQQQSTAEAGDNRKNVCASDTLYFCRIMYCSSSQNFRDITMSTPLAGRLHAVCVGAC